MTQAMQFYCVRSLILFLITDLASGEMLYCSKNFDVSFSNRFLNSGSLAGPEQNFANDLSVLLELIQAVARREALLYILNA